MLLLGVSYCPREDATLGLMAAELSDIESEALGPPNLLQLKLIMTYPDEAQPNLI